MQAVGSDGSGLGLFIARRLMQDQGGTIAVEPEGRWRSSFVLRLRVGPAVDLSRRQAPDVDDAAQTHRILIVDDHPLIAIGLQLALAARGWEVDTTSGPTAAAVVARPHVPA